MKKSDIDNLFRYAMALTRDEDSAYDLLQSGLERGLKKGLSTMENPLAYIKVIIRNIFFDQQRRNKVVPILSIEQSTETFDTESDDISLEDLYIQQEDVERVISCLSAAESELLYLWAVEEYTADEIAVLFEQPRGTVLSKLHRLKKRLRENIDQQPVKYIGKQYEQR